MYVFTELSIAVAFHPSAFPAAACSATDFPSTWLRNAVASVAISIALGTLTLTVTAENAALTRLSSSTRSHAIHNPRQAQGANYWRGGDRILGTINFKPLGGEYNILDVISVYSLWWPGALRSRPPSHKQTATVIR